jgi:hypothetical protein
MAMPCSGEDDMQAGGRLIRMASIVALILSGLAVAGATVPASAADASKSFVPVTPTRFVDTRQGLGGSYLHVGETLVMPVAGRSPVPPSGAVAVAINVTVTNPSSVGFLTVWPSGKDRPVASNLNYVAQETVANLVIVGVGSNGAVNIYSQQATDVVVDVVGWFYAGFNPVTPARLMDTRHGLGGMVLGPHERRDLLVQHQGGLPDSVIGAVALNVTVTEPTQAGFLTVWPSGVAQPLASNLNFVAGKTTPNAVVVGVGSGGWISLYNSNGNSHVIVDVAGWFAPGFGAVTPVRVVDTRDGLGGLKLAPGEVRSLKVIGRGDVPDSTGVAAVSLNVTATDPTAAGFLTVWPAGLPRPLASNLNFAAGQTVANAVPVGVDENGQISIYNSSGDTDVIVDVTGWYARSDTTAPRLESMTITPSTIDTSTGPQMVTLTLHITDNLSGVAARGIAEVSFFGPGNQQVYANFHDGDQVSGTSVDGVYTTTAVVPALSPKGTFSIDRLIVADNAGNHLYLDHKDLVGRGLATSFEQIGDGDAAPPEIRSLGFDRAAVDTSTGAQTITLTARLTDDFSGVRFAFVQFFNIAGQVQVAPFYWSSLRSGTALDGIYEGALAMPMHSAPGTWYIDVLSMYDQVGNVRMLTRSELAAQGMPTSFEQTGPGDTTPPTLRELSWTPTTINTASAAQQIAITARITDSLAGMRPDYWRPSITFLSPSGQSLLIYLNQQIAGTPFDSVVTGVLTVPAFSESGVWTLVNMLVPDAVGNQRMYYATDLAAQGMPTTFTNN